MQVEKCFEISAVVCRLNIWNTVSVVGPLFQRACKYALSVKGNGLRFEEKTGGKILRSFKIPAKGAHKSDTPDGLRG